MDDRLDEIMENELKDISKGGFEYFDGSKEYDKETNVPTNEEMDFLLQPKPKKMDAFDFFYENRKKFIINYPEIEKAEDAVKKAQIALKEHLEKQELSDNLKLGYQRKIESFPAIINKERKIGFVKGYSNYDDIPKKTKGFQAA